MGYIKKDVWERKCDFCGKMIYYSGFWKDYVFQRMLYNSNSSTSNKVYYCTEKCYNESFIRDKIKRRRRV